MNVSVSVRPMAGESYHRTIERKVWQAEEELLRLEGLIARRKQRLMRQHELFVALRETMAAWSHLEPLPVVVAVCPACRGAGAMFDPDGPCIRMGLLVMPLSPFEGRVVAELVAAGGGYRTSATIAARLGTTADNVRNRLCRVRGRLAAAGIDPARVFSARNHLGLRWLGELPT